VAALVTESRATIERIIRGDDPRFMAIVGPCSIHDEGMAIEYAERLARLAATLADRLFVVMRVYFEKPRTTLGWKGLINDPFMDDSFQIEEGLRRARRILLRVGQLGLPAGTEMLEPITPQYIADLVSWASIGARTTESPTHRQMASGLSMPVGYKNSTDGTIDNATNAMLSARMPHNFLGVDDAGLTCIIRTKGNNAGHLILRGGKNGPNYDRANVAAATELLQKEGLSAGVMIDCSHANSNKDYRRQAEVWRDVVAQHREDYKRIIGGMLESNLVEGKQALGSDPSQLKYGVSITDGCIGWEQTEELLQWAYESITPPTVAV
jgi:3-deoxy-7-phosphoheptulonate synthase